MSTLSVPLTPSLETFVEQMVQQGIGSNKADVARRALLKMQEDQFVEAVLRSEQEMREGKILRGDLRELLKQLT